MDEYLVLIPCGSDITEKRFAVGAVVTNEDFPEEIINHWLEKTPPVLAEIVPDIDEEE